MKGTDSRPSYGVCLTSSILFVGVSIQLPVGLVFFHPLPLLPPAGLPALSHRRVLPLFLLLLTPTANTLGDFLPHPLEGCVKECA